MKKFTYSFLSILMLLLAIPAGLLARTTVTFDFAANPWGLPLSTSEKGELDKGAITSPISQDGVTLTTTDGTNKTKMWVADGAIDFRVYKKGGSFTFTAPKGKVIEKIEFTGTVAATADAGTYDGSSTTWAQPKEQVNAVKFKATGTNKISKAVLTIADPGEEAEVVVLPEIPDFASLKAAEQDKAVKLTVTNGKVVYAGSKDLIVEDATGAIDFYNWGVKATAGQVINGVVEAKYDEFLGMPQAAKTANTDVAALTITDGDAVAPVAMEFADAMKAASYLKYVTLTDFTIEETGGKTYLVNGENKIQLYDKFKVGYTLPEAIKSISGIIIPFVANGSTDVIVEIAPTSAEDIEDIVAKPVLPEGDVTAKYLVNPGFEDCEAATGKVATAGSAQGTDYEAVGWKLVSSAAWSNSAAFAYGSDASLNDAAVPATDNAGNTGKALGITVGWGGTNSYQSAAEVVLPAGYYTLKAHAYNGGTATQFASKLGFATADKAYTSTKNSFALNEWVEDVVEFTLESETAGHFTIGGAAVGGGSGANGKVFFDNITLERQDLFTAVNNNLAKEIATAKEIASAGLAPTADLLAAIATAEAATTKTDYKEILAAIEPLKAAVATYNDVNAHFVAFADAKAKYATLDTKYATEAKIAAVNAIAAKTPATADEADALKADYIKAVRVLAESNALAEGVEGATNYTESIKNANAEALEGWTTALGEINKGKIEIKNGEPFTDAAGNSTHSYFDGGSWGDKAWDVTFSQKVTLPKGKYLLTATSRASVDLTSFTLFAGEARADMQHVGNAGELFDRGWNDNSVEFEVAEDDATVNLGVQGVADKQYQWMSFTRFRLVKVGETAAYKEVNSIAELRKLEFKDDTETILVKLNLHDAHISALNKAKDSGPELLSETDSEVEGGDAAEAEEVINFAILEDATGAIDISNLLQSGIDAGMISGKFELGTVLNGYLYAEFNYPNALWLPEEWTEKSEFTTTPSTLAPTESTLAEIVKPENDLRLFTLKDVTIKNVATEDAPDYNICQGEASIMLSDGFFNVFGETMPEKVESVTGILYGVFEEFGEAPASYMFVPTAASTSETPAVPVVDNIAGLSKVEGGEMEDPSIKLMLKNAKITFVGKDEGGIDPRSSVSFAFLEDETGAVEISNIINTAEAKNLFEGGLKEGVELNGYINVNYNSMAFALVANDETPNSEFTITPTTVVPTPATIADVQKTENNMRYYELKDVDFAIVDEVPVFKQGEASIPVVDLFEVLPEEMPEKFESVNGILFLDFESFSFIPVSYTAAEAKPIEVNSIADLNKLGEENEGATIKLKLTDAQITVADASMSSAIIEDKTGAFNAQYFFAEAVGMEMLKDEFKQGAVLNGYLYATYSYGSIEVCDLTAESEIAVTEAPVVPTEADFAEVLKAENNYRLYEFKNITVNKNEDDKFQLVKGDAKAEIADRTRSLEESMMANVESVVGYFRIVGDEAEFTLISYKTATPNGISALEVAAKNAAVYNLNGAKVLGAGESVKGLAKGIYVVGGKKIVVK